MNREWLDRPLTLRRRAPAQAAALLQGLGVALTEHPDGPAIARRVGETLAPDVSAPRDESVPSLERALNEAFAAFDLGYVRLGAASDCLVIDAYDYPALHDAPHHSELVVCGLLEGLLTGYLNRLARADHLAARLSEPPASTAAPLRFLYSRRA